MGQASRSRIASRSPAASSPTTRWACGWQRGRGACVFITTDPVSESPCTRALQLVNFLRTTYEGTVAAGSLDGLILSGVGPTSLRLCEGISACAATHLGCRGRPLTPFGAPFLAASVPNVVSVRRCHGRRPDGRDHCGARGAEALQRPSRRRLDREVRQARRQRRNLCALASTLTPPRPALHPRIVQTRSYRELLDRWQLWQERAAFDVAARRLYGPGAADTQSGPALMLTPDPSSRTHTHSRNKSNPDVRPPPQVTASCNFCNQPLLPTAAAAGRPAARPTMIQAQRAKVS